MPGRGNAIGAHGDAGGVARPRRRHRLVAGTLHESLRRLTHAVLDHHCGRLDEDATVLLAEWRAGHEHRLVP
ncbi:MAG: hypothetical protein ACJ736_20505 [Streptomyces sp.]